MGAGVCLWLLFQAAADRLADRGGDHACGSDSVFWVRMPGAALARRDGADPCRLGRAPAGPARGGADGRGLCDPADGGPGQSADLDRYGDGAVLCRRLVFPSPAGRNPRAALCGTGACSAWPSIGEICRDGEICWSVYGLNSAARRLDAHLACASAGRNAAPAAGGLWRGDFAQYPVEPWPPADDLFPYRRQRRLGAADEPLAAACGDRWDFCCRKPPWSASCAWWGRWCLGAADRAARRAGCGPVAVHRAADGGGHRAGACLGEAQANWAVAAYFAGTVLAVRAWRSRPRWLVASFVINAVFCVALPLLVIFTGLSFLDGKPLLDRQLGRAAMSQQIIALAHDNGDLPILRPAAMFWPICSIPGRAPGLAFMPPAPRVAPTITMNSAIRCPKTLRGRSC